MLNLDSMYIYIYIWISMLGTRSKGKISIIYVTIIYYHGPL